MGRFREPAAGPDPGDRLGDPLTSAVTAQGRRNQPVPRPPRLTRRAFAPSTALPATRRGSCTIAKKPSLLGGDRLAADAGDAPHPSRRDDREPSSSQILRYSIALENCAYCRPREPHLGCDSAGAEAVLDVEAADLDLDFRPHFAASHGSASMTRLWLRNFLTGDLGAR